MKGTIINGVPHVLVKLPWLIETMHKAFGDAKIERLSQPPVTAEQEFDAILADIRSKPLAVRLTAEQLEELEQERIGAEFSERPWMY